MVKFDVDEIKESADEDYEKAWKESAKHLDTEGRFLEWERGEGESHPINDLAEDFRDIFLSYGFKEVINPTIINEADVYKEYGPEAAVILDRCFYLAGLPRPDLGIEKGKVEKIKEIGDVDTEKLKKIFREYKEGEIESDDLLEEFVIRLGVNEDEATKILELFPELENLKPVPTNLTLRSHTTAAWFPTLSDIVYIENLPLKLFSIASKFRREQKLDQTHTYESLTASLVTVAENITVEDGKDISKKILSELGFESIDMRKKKATSKYYAPGTEFEIFVKHPKTGEMIEVGNGGLYSPVALSRYNIPYPVFNLGFGIERIAMMLNNEEDIRRLVRPHEYKEADFSDKELAEMIKLKKRPQTEEGKEIKERIEDGIKNHKDDVGPDEFLVYENPNIRVYVTEPEEGQTLLGPAGLNELYVRDGDILAVEPGNEDFQEVIEKGERVRSYIDSISNMFARLAEEQRFGRHTVKFADSLPKLNLELDAVAENYITSNQKKIDIGGPVFVDVKIERKEG